MKNITEKKQSSNYDIAIWILILAATIAAVAVTYFLNVTTAIKAIAWICWFLIVIGLVYTTAKGKKILTFFRESKIELLKVVWPSKQETVQTTTIVMVMVAITGVVLWGIDSGMMWVIGKITRLG